MLQRILQTLLALFLQWLKGSSAPRRVPERVEPDAAPDVVRVAYAPRLDGDPDPGEVVWTWVPYEEDPAQGKDRPVLIVGHRRDKLACVALTSKRHERSEQVEVGVGPWDREGRTSYAKIDRIIDVTPASVRREGAVLDRARFDRVVAALRSAHGAMIRRA